MKESHVIDTSPVKNDPCFLCKRAVTFTDRTDRCYFTCNCEKTQRMMIEGSDVIGMNASFHKLKHGVKMDEERNIM